MVYPAAHAAPRPHYGRHSHSMPGMPRQGQHSVHSMQNIACGVDALPSMQPVAAWEDAGPAHQQGSSSQQMVSPSSMESLQAIVGRAQFATSDCAPVSQRTSEQPSTKNSPKHGGVSS